MRVTGIGRGAAGSQRRDDPARSAGENAVDALLCRVAKGDEAAFGELYDALAGPVLATVRKVVRDPAHSEEVVQEVMLELWRTASRFDARRGSAVTWALTMAHRRAVDRVRASEASRDRERAAAAREGTVAYDTVAEQVEVRLEQRQVRRCLGTLTPVQRESVTLAYYGGLTYREVSERLKLPLGTVKTRLRDGLIRLRDCLGVSA
ncbi:MAG TPA: ECF RNA polymerase sigma factor SigK [Yinghuangia sp.]|uniref:ECF RNA polymerase sigma factor SigK n=1 Tax=Yinghuangia sp. YIM S10712 TaxID=3436930 RepID=UPI002CC7047C|nr:ECF RNA polymerase sigma factor SigK [Yinghuangia sp.]